MSPTEADSALLEALSAEQSGRGDVAGFIRGLVKDACGFETCRGCLATTDAEWCWCGSHVDRHGGYDGHAPVPMGCRCHMERS